MENSLLTGEEVISATGGTILVNSPIFFTSVVTDSRNCVKDSAFFPLRGEQDGHKYFSDALKLGASVIFIDEIAYRERGDYYNKVACDGEGENTCAIVVVKNTLHALQDMAAKYVSKFPLLIKVAITGSSGKTTTKEILVAMLRQKYNVVCNKGNLNSETGLPLSVFEINSNNQIGVFEMGMNRKGEIAEISAVLKANFALITNIGTAHIGILGSRDDIAFEKRHVFDYISENGAAFINTMDEYAKFLSEGVRGAIIPFGNFVDPVDSGVKYKKDCGIDGTDFFVDDLPVHLKLSGVCNYVNALGAIAVAKRLGLNKNEIKLGIESVTALGDRMDCVKVTLKNNKHVTLIKDCYNANPDSVKNALEFCATLGGRATFVLGDMLELGDKSFEAHTAVGSIVASDKPFSCIFIGSQMKAAFDKALSRNYQNAHYYADSSDDTIKNVSKYLLENTQDNDVILLKASRGLRFERLVPLITLVKNEDTRGESKC